MLIGPACSGPTMYVQWPSDGETARFYRHTLMQLKFGSPIFIQVATLKYVQQLKVCPACTILGFLCVGSLRHQPGGRDGPEISGGEGRPAGTSCVQLAASR